MLYLLHTHWLWVFGALALGIGVGWITYLPAATRWTDRPVHIAIGLVAIGAILALTELVPGRYGYWLELAVIFAFVYTAGCFVGWALRDLAEFVPAAARPGAATTTGSYLFRAALAGTGAGTYLRAAAGDGAPARARMPAAAAPLAQAPAPGGYTFPKTPLFADATTRRPAAPTTGLRRHWTWQAPATAAAGAAASAFTGSKGGYVFPVVTAAAPARDPREGTTRVGLYRHWSWRGAEAHTATTADAAVVAGATPGATGSAPVVAEAPDLPAAAPADASAAHGTTHDAPPAPDPETPSVAGAGGTLAGASPDGARSPMSDAAGGERPVTPIPGGDAPLGMPSVAGAPAAAAGDAPAAAARTEPSDAPPAADAVTPAVKGAGAVGALAGASAEDAGTGGDAATGTSLMAPDSTQPRREPAGAEAAVTRTIGGEQTTGPRPPGIGAPSAAPDTSAAVAPGPAASGASNGEPTAAANGSEAADTGPAAEAEARRGDQTRSDSAPPVSSAGPAGDRAGQAPDAGETTNARSGVIPAATIPGRAASIGGEQTIGVSEARRGSRSATSGPASGAGAPERVGGGTPEAVAADPAGATGPTPAFDSAGDAGGAATAGLPTAPPAAPGEPATIASVPGETAHAGERPQGLVAARDDRPDDLKRIRGIGPQNEGRLHGLGIWHFDQIAAWTPENVRWVGSYLVFPGRIGREKWVEQATALAGGGGAIDAGTTSRPRKPRR